MDPFRHHAHVLYGSDALILPLLSLLAQAGFSATGNPDYHAVVEPLLSIDAARAIFERTRTAVPLEGRRVVVIVCMQATAEAQNALLKLTEEPPQRTHFYFIVPSPDALLPTLRSRLQSLPLTTLGSSALDVGAFLNATFSERIAFLEPIIEEKKHAEALALLNAIEERVAKQGSTHKDALAALATAREYLLRRGSSLKLVLEYLALSVPKLS